MNDEQQQAFASDLKEEARKQGALQFGIASALPLPEHIQHYQNWINKGNAADLWYMTEPVRKSKREDPRLLLDGAQSIWMASFNYKPAQEARRSSAKFARYGWGRDYHKFIKKRMRRILEWAQARCDEEFDAKIYVDTGPLLERAYAEASGLGWIGKNTCLIDIKGGSYTYLASIITTLKLPADKPVLPHCGTCTRCLDACPTNAFDGPYQLNAAKCISYQTIENKSLSIPEQIKNAQNDWVAGCDICQEVCPWNRKSPVTELPECKPKDYVTMGKDELSKLSEEAYLKLFEGSSFRRIKHQKMQSNCE